MQNNIKICYLCGQELNCSDKSTNYDHVPPRQFYAKYVRRKHNPNLLTLPVHRNCNKEFQKDEDYFVNSIAPLAKGSYSGNAIWQDISNQLKRPEGSVIGKMVLKEFDPMPSGIILPYETIAKRFDGNRVWRVVWKITRGLFFKEKGKILPENTPRSFEIVPVNNKPPEIFRLVRDTPSRGQYPGVFDYKYIEGTNSNKVHLWSFLLWDRLIIIIGFHDPSCLCEKCGNKLKRDAQ